VANLTRSALVNYSLPHWEYTVPDNEAPGYSHCRHGYCVCVLKTALKPWEMSEDWPQQHTMQMLGALQSGRILFEQGDIGLYRPDGYPHVTHAYTCSTLYSDSLLWRIVGNLLRSPRIKTFSTLKRLPREIELRSMYAFYLWKVIMVPCTWVVETEVFIYRFRKHDNRQWEGLRREHEPMPEEVSIEMDAATDEAQAAISAVEAALAEDGNEAAAAQKMEEVAGVAEEVHEAETSS